jgi:hypothetical protein
LFTSTLVSAGCAWQEARAVAVVWEPCAGGPLPAKGSPPRHVALQIRTAGGRQSGRGLAKCLPPEKRGNFPVHRPVLVAEPAAPAPAPGTTCPASFPAPLSPPETGNPSATHAPYPSERRTSC